MSIASFLSDLFQDERQRPLLDRLLVALFEKAVAHSCRKAQIVNSAAFSVKLRCVCCSSLVVSPLTARDGRRKQTPLFLAHNPSTYHHHPTYSAWQAIAVFAPFVHDGILPDVLRRVHEAMEVVTLPQIRWYMEMANAYLCMRCPSVGIPALIERVSTFDLRPQVKGGCR